MPARALTFAGILGTNTAFVLLMLGISGIYAELVWPGRVIPGVVGLGGALAGAYFLFRPPLDAPAIALLVAALALLAGEALWGPYLLLGSLGVIALVAGFFLLDPPRRIEPALGVPVSLVFGVFSMLLAASAKRARRNKRSGLGAG